MPRSEQGLFQALEQELKHSKEPMDCHTLFDKPSVRQHAQTVNRVSDYLGGLWRKGKVLRLPAPRTDNSRSRWMYQWKDAPRRGHSNVVALNDANLQAPTPAPAPVPAYVPPGSRKVLSRPTIEITDGGDVITIELPNATLVIRPKGSAVS
jgi:hypothetical protein